MGRARGGWHSMPSRSAIEMQRTWAWNATLDRKSTRLNSSHQIISYAVFCLKKKKTKQKSIQKNISYSTLSVENNNINMTCSDKSRSMHDIISGAQTHTSYMLALTEH